PRWARSGPTPSWSPRTRSARDLDDPVRAALGVDHHVGDERVVAGFGEGQLDEAALRGRQVQALAAAVPGGEQVAALLVGRVELGPDDVERRGAVGAGVEHPDPDPLARPGR